MTVEEWLGKDNQLGIDIWNKKYHKVINDKEETFDEWVNRVSDGYVEIAKLVKEKKFLPGGRIMSNIGIEDDKRSMMNCYSRGFVNDDYDDLLKAAWDIGKTFKYQGGQGISLSKLRPVGTPIGKEYVSDGIIPFMKIYNEVTEGTSQGGARKGALMISLDAWHKEAMNFITIKSKEGLIEKANISLEIDDEFMRAVETYYKTGEIVKINRKENYSGHEVEWEVTPIDLFKAMVSNNYDWGDPGCLFVDRFRNFNIMEKVDEYQIETCNPSLRAGTQVLTTNGPCAIEKLEGQKFMTYNINGERVLAECFKSGLNKQLYEITLDNGEKYYCTPEHKWPVLNKKTNEYNKALTTDLKKGDYLPLNQNTALSDGTLGTYEDGLTCGLFCGDGSITKRSDDGRYQYGYTCGQDDTNVGIRDFIQQQLSKITEKTINYSTRNRGGQDWYEFSCGDNKLYQYFVQFGFESKSHFPTKFYTECSEDFRRGFISGLISADGTVGVCNMGKRISLSTASNTLAKDFSEAMWWYGIRNHMYTSTRRISFNRKDEKDYVLYYVAIGKSVVQRFAQLFTIFHKRKQERIDLINHKGIKHHLLKCSNMQIVNVQLSDIHEDVWDIHVYDDTHTFSLNYCVTGNCGEQPLPKNMACCLSSLNLAEFVLNPYTEKASFDHESFNVAVKNAVEYLDHIVDINAPRHPLKEQTENSLAWRNIGLGIFGYGSALMKLGLVYGSDEACWFTDGVFFEMFRNAVIASSNLAKIKSPFPNYNEKVWDSEIIKNHFSEEEINQLKKNGLRNCSVLSIAPTGSLATMLGETGGCEPEFAISFTRRTVGLTDNEDHYYKVYCKAAKEYMEANNTDKLPEWFVGSSDIEPNKRIKVQSIMQDHVDTAISSTINLPESSTKEEMEQIYLNAWKSGLKGLTIFRTNCKKAGILTLNSPKDKEEEEFEEDMIKTTSLPWGSVIQCTDDCIGKKRKLQTGCVDGETEFFTGFGWKKISEYTGGDMVLQYNHDGTATLVSPIEYIKRPTERSYHIKTKYGLDMVVSHDHRNVVFGYRNKPEILTTDELISNHNNNKHGLHKKFKLSFLYEGSGIKLTDDEIRLKIAIFADGSYHGREMIGDKCSIAVKKVRKRNRLIEILNNLKIDYNERINKEGYYIISFYPPFEKTKHFTKEWYNCTIHQKEVIKNEIFNWDGYQKKNNEYTTINKDDADFIQFVFSSLNYRGSIYKDNRPNKKGYRVDYSERNYASIMSGISLKKNTIKEHTNEDGYDYCFKVPSGMLVLRRNDKIFITGNCGSLHVSAWFDPITGDLMETFFDKGSSGGCNSFMVGLSRMVSLACRAGVDIHAIKDQLDSTIVCPSYAVRTATKRDTSKGSSCPMAIGNALIEMYDEVKADLFDGEDDVGDISEKRIVKVLKKEPEYMVGADGSLICPECGSPMVHEGGCDCCKNCGYSHCG